MKKIFIAIAVICSLSATAQMKEGRVVYQRTMQIQFRSPNMDPAIAAQLPKARTDEFELLFSATQSLWQSLPGVSGDEQSFGGGSVMIRSFGGGNNDVTFCNFEKSVRVDQRELADRNFLITDSLQKLTWKLTGESKQILGHNALKAFTTRIATRSRMTMENGEMKRTEFPDTAKVVAWFATDIPVPAGPDFVGQLPGLILELDIDNGQTVYRATEISPKVNAAKIKEPKDGKKMTAAEFKIERDKIMEQMRKNMSQNGGSIRIQN